MATPTILRTADEKIQFYRDALLGNDTRLRIVVGNADSGRKEALLQAFDTIKSEDLPANQFNYGNEMLFPVKNIRRVVDAIHFIPKQTMAGAAKEMEEYGEEECEVVIFE
jgi:hypothetical protein